MNIRTLLNSGEVVRFHSHVGIDKQKISEHQWGVTLIVQKLYPDCSKKLLLAALTHDSAEYYTGDIPFNLKQDNIEVKSLMDSIEESWKARNGVAYDLTLTEKITLKLADVLEGMRYCVLQVRIGNINARRPYRKWKKFFIEFTDNYCFDDNSLLNDITVEAKELYHRIEKDMEKLNDGSK